jgi:hypothetical protein
MRKLCIFSYLDDEWEMHFDAVLVLIHIERHVDKLALQKTTRTSKRTKYNE